MARQIAEAALKFQLQHTGHAAESVTVVLAGVTLVITLYGALSKAEKALANSPHGATKVRELHQQLFANTSQPLRQEITRITGAQVRESTADIATGAGAVVHALTSGAMVQVFLLSQKVPNESWIEPASSDPVPNPHISSDFLTDLWRDGPASCRFGTYHSSNSNKEAEPCEQTVTTQPFILHPWLGVK